MPTTAVALPYEVIALHPGTASSCWRSVGRYPDLEGALRARVEDVLSQLVANDGWLVNSEHLVVGPGADGPATVRCCVTEIGADPGSDRVPDPFKLDTCRAWLLAAHALS